MNSCFWIWICRWRVTLVMDYKKDDKLYQYMYIYILYIYIYKRVIRKHGLKFKTALNNADIWIWLENYALLVYYIACSGNSLPSFWNSLSVPTYRTQNPYRYQLQRSRIKEDGFLILDDGPDKLSRHDDRELPRHAA